MGGISAAFRAGGEPLDSSKLERLEAAIHHRGQSSSTWCEGSAGLAHRRARHSLPDSQPAVHTESGLHLVLAGRIYNQAEVESKLMAAGVAAASRNQTETILAAYALWGEGFAEHLDGEYSLALYDEKRQGMLCVLDAVGTKPLYYAFDGRELLVGSEQKQLLAAGVSSDPNEEVVANYLSLSSTLVGGPGTFYRDVRRIEPGQWIWVDADGVRSGFHWQLDPNHKIAETTLESMAEHVRALLLDSVRRRVPPQGPYACALSGGFDSSSVAALYRLILDERATDEDLLTFSFELRSDDADEPEIIRAVSHDVKSQHHSVFLDKENVFDVLPNMLDAGDEPTRDIGLLLLWKKKARARSLGVDVILSGLGGDELFLGRLQYLADLFRSGRFPTLWREINSFIPIDRSTGKKTSLRHLITSYMVAPLMPRTAKNFFRRHVTRNDPVGPWMQREFAERSGLVDRLWSESPRTYPDHYRHYCHDVMRYDVQSLTFPIHDSLNGQFAIDTRFPILDKRMVEYCFAVPREQKISMGHSRILQRAAMKGILPPVVLEEHIKKNFHPTLERQQRASFQHELDGVLSKKTHLSSAYIDWDHIRSKQVEYMAGGWYQLWYAINVERWLEHLAHGPKTAK